MQTTTLGRTGLRVSRLCLGTMTFGWSADEQTSFEIMDTAFDAGLTFFDTADMYSKWVEGNDGGVSERIIGKWLQTKNRREVIIATKARAQMWAGANGEGLSRHHLIHAVEDSLRRLDTDYIDLYQVHWFDEKTPLDETLRAMDDLITAGKIRYAGCSNYPAWMLTKASWVADVKNLTRYDSLQPHYSIFHRKEFERELAAACQDMNIGVIPYSPLAGGFATGKYTRENRSPDTTRQSSSIVQKLIDDDAAYEALDVLRDIADANDVPIAQIALAWLLHQPGVTAPIVGARTVEQLEATLSATEVTLSADELKLLDEATESF